MRVGGATARWDARDMHMQVHMQMHMHMHMCMHMHINMCMRS